MPHANIRLELLNFTGCRWAILSEKAAESWFNIFSRKDTPVWYTKMAAVTWPGDVEQCQLQLVYRVNVNQLSRSTVINNRNKTFQPKGHCQHQSKFNSVEHWVYHWRVILVSYTPSRAKVGPIKSTLTNSWSKISSLSLVICRNANFGATRDICLFVNKSEIKYLLDIHVGWKKRNIKKFRLLYSGKFSYGTNFHTFYMCPLYAKL